METIQKQPKCVYGYKGFDKDLKCLNYQYKIGRTYTINGDIKLCINGFHFCNEPLNVIQYYPIKDGNRFCIVSAPSESIISDNIKSVTNDITIEQEIKVEDFRKLCTGIYIDSDGDKHWYKEGKRYRDDGPAIEYNDGSKEWYKEGKLHRDDGPAIECIDGTKEWWKEGNLHREDGPAIEYANGDKEWYKEDKLHREDGPAIEWSDGDKEWWKEGNRCEDPVI